MGFELSINTWSVFVNRAVHWVAFDPAKEHGFGILIVAFDMGNEVFREISLPNYQPDGRLHTSTAVKMVSHLSDGLHKSSSRFDSINRSGTPIPPADGFPEGIRVSERPESVASHGKRED
ncbi:hypothetical protein LOK49_LG08G03384 [Camellia lanceoleosa]|uniref:Uncharacterized protein n=1 Tax=Camellia lanceoleosa TaxID=1840588 RepID=A0ACC0GVJ7_9ERIC|nr:hypothetical protein LOK49_LG08G03384 [Camellia lanceoleosa]